MKRKPLLKWSFYGLLLAGAAGCGGGEALYPVSGKVTFPDGTPLTKGRVNFDSEKRSAFGPIQPDGTFELTSVEPGDGVPAGTYKVTIAGAWEGTGGGAHGGMFVPTTPLIASEFESTDTTPLTQEVSDSISDLKIEVQPPKKK